MKRATCAPPATSSPDVLIATNDRELLERRTRHKRKKEQERKVAGVNAKQTRRAVRAFGEASARGFRLKNVFSYRLGDCYKLRASSRDQSAANRQQQRAEETEAPSASADDEPEPPLEVYDLVGKSPIEVERLIERLNREDGFVKSPRSEPSEYEINGKRLQRVFRLVEENVSEEDSGGE